MPVIVATSPAHDPVTPAGKPAKVAPVAPVVARVMSVMALLIHIVWSVPAAIVFNRITVMVPVVAAGGQPPVVVTV